MKKILLLLFSVLYFSSHAQFPHIQKKVCLDRITNITTNTIAPNARNMVVADVDGDSLDDVILVDMQPAIPQLMLYKNNAGAFTPSVIAALSGSNINFCLYNSIDVGHFNNDKKFDIAVNYDNMVKLFMNDGTGNFTSTYTYTYPLVYKDSISYMKVEDFNADSYSDIFIVTNKTAPLSIYGLAIRNTFTTSNTPSLTLEQQIIIKPNGGIKSTDILGMSVYNYNGDAANRNDVIVNHEFSLNQIFVVENTCAGTGAPLSFTNHTVNVVYNYDIKTKKVHMKDIDQDGKQDIIVLANVYLLGSTYWEGFAFFPMSSFSMVASTFSDLAISQVVNQGQLILTSDFNNMPVPGFGAINTFELTDVNSDGLNDIVFMNENYFAYHLHDSIAQPNVTTTFNSSPVTVSLPAGTGANEMALGNFDNNRLTDYYFKNYNKPGRPGVIPNFAYTLKSVAGNTTACTGVIASMSAVITPTSQTSPPSNTINWLATPGNSIAGTATQVFTTSTPGTYYPLGTLNLPSGQGMCTIRSYPYISTVTVAGISDPTITPTKSVEIVCPGTSATLSATGTGSGSVLLDWKKNGVTLGSGITDFVTDPVQGLEMYEVVGTDVLTSCVGSNTIFVNVFPENQNRILAEKNPVCLGDSTRLSFPSATSYTWNTFITSSNKNDPSIFIKPHSSSEEVTLDYIDSNACKNSQVIRVNVDLVCDIKIYNSVTPNGDLANDIWVIDNINRFPNNYVAIYNRWGMKIFDTKGYDNIYNYWPPKDIDLPASTYFYIIDLDGKADKLKGWIELIK